MRLLSTILLGLTVFTNPATAENTNSWLELSFGGGGEDLMGVKTNIKFGDLKSNWAIEFSNYEDFRILSYAKDRANDKILNPEVKTIAITKNWTSTKRLGYFEAGVGLGLAKGTWTSNCFTEKSPSGGWGSSTYDLCDSVEGYRVGLPLHLSAVFGKYVGIGLTLNAFITSENSHLGVMLTIPLGDFTH
ncbi:hypothetical protein Q4575_17740 [Psychrosphaera sp. 1_MG-2023]|uniref:Outer membrane protein beta-barrel domain-containing protein n=1 Tax=Psychrosphaera algicola TaxID=3023714 RepID=A0ABT5FJ09_9GAMM|nr:MULTISPECIES: hypothetical protein [unclassified Psychrosphaera]MDC2891183.1 hypothetical protein [Psychrosphaera sp. G1-22]MDO6721257.1 hypothetical protein [Psychrosphaera sp. 1_MG-2023]